MTKAEFHSPLPQILHATQDRPDDWVAMRFKRSGQWVDWTWRDYFKAVESCGRALLSLGIQPQDRIAVFSRTRVEWACADLGVMSIRAVTVPVYFNAQAEDVAFILNDSQSRILILEGPSQLKKWKSIRSQCPSIETVIVLEEKTALSHGELSWKQFLAGGDAVPADSFERILKSTNFDDISTIVYTSGTSGQPKGVVLGHTQILSELKGVNHIFDISHQDITLSFLPYAHVLGRIEMWLNIYCGFTLALAEGIEKIRPNLLEIHPTVMIAVPRIFEKIHAAVMTRLENKPLAGKLFQLLRALPLGPLKRPILKRVLSPVREALGGRLRFAISGGAPLSPDVDAFFRMGGISIFEGYGLTETTAAICTNTEKHHRSGTVGKPLPDVEIRLAEDGEILVKSHKVMREYYKDPWSTEAALENGYFKTGDIGHFDQDGYLHITDRKKDLIKTSAGKYVAPQRLENLLKKSPLISHVVVFGDRQKYIVALITLSGDALTQQTEVKKLVNDLVKQCNKELASYETIKKFTILPGDFTVEAGELTPSLKVRRKFCSEKYKDLIAAMYEGHQSR